MSEARTIKALSVRQPWAWALIYGVERPKRIENRSRKTWYFGQLVIHASKTLADYRSLPLARWREEIPDLPDLLAEPFERHFGCLYGLLELVNDLPFDEVRGQPYAEGPRCWITQNPRAIEPVPYRGSLGLFDVPADQIVIRPGPRGPSIVSVHKSRATTV